MRIKWHNTRKYLSQNLAHCKYSTSGTVVNLMFIIISEEICSHPKRREFGNSILNINRYLEHNLPISKSYTERLSQLVTAA